MRLAALGFVLAACSPTPVRGPQTIESHAVIAPKRSAAPMAVTGFPLPPHQQEPWTPQAGALPAALVAAATVLFDQGLADPRDLAYREVELAIGSVWSGDGGTVKTRGWIVPAKQGKWAIAWNGLVYRVTNVGAPADLAADIAALIAKDTAQHGASRFPILGEFDGVAADSVTSTKVLLLLRLGATALAETVWRALVDDDNIARAVEHDPYLWLASDWEWSLFDRAVTAHMRGDHELALASARAIAAVSPLVEAEAARRDIKLHHDDQKPGRYVGFVEPATSLLADEERLATLPPRPALSTGAALAALDPPTRVARLIDHLDEVAARQNGQPGGVDLAEDPIVIALIAEGEAAVEPLIAIVESDTRLTRSVHFGRSFHRSRNLIGVHEAAYVALAGILQTSFFGVASTGDDLSARGMAGRKEVATKLRAYWAKWKGVSLEERWFRTLADDQGNPGDWLAVAEKITRPTNVTVSPGSMAFTTTITTPVTGPVGMTGEPLRAHTTPSLSSLLERRVAQMPDVRSACQLALAFARWDKAAAKHTLELQMTRALATPDSAPCIAALTEARVAAGDPAAVAAYASWIVTQTPARFGNDVAMLEPMAQLANRAVIARASDAMFRDGSAWVPLVASVPGRSNDISLLATDLIHVRGFNHHVVAALADRRIAGTLTMPDDEIHYNVAFVTGDGTGSNVEDPATSPGKGTTRQVRVADWYAWSLARGHAKAPRFEAYWTDAQRDAALVRMIAWVKWQLVAAPVR